MSARHTDKPVLVIGLGRFGGAVATSLMRSGHEVLGIDTDERIVQEMTADLTHVVQADTTDIEALRKLGATDFGCAVVGIGTDLEASVLTVLALVDLGLADIWAKATNSRHGRILERTGAHHVVYPEARMGERVAHLLSGKMLDYIAFDDEFAIVKMLAPRWMAEQTLAEARVRARHGVTVVGLKRVGEDFLHARPETVVRGGDLLIISGEKAKVEAFAANSEAQ